jgi:hypothetical protein
MRLRGLWEAGFLAVWVVVAPSVGRAQSSTDIGYATPDMLSSFQLDDQGLEGVCFGSLGPPDCHWCADLAEQLEPWVAVQLLAGAQKLQYSLRLGCHLEPGEIWTGTYIPLGLNYPPEAVAHLFREVRRLKDSSTYRAILAEGKARGSMKGFARGEAVGSINETQRILLFLGKRNLGEPDEATQIALEAITDRDRLEETIDRLDKATDWADLLDVAEAQPKP